MENLDTSNSAVLASFFACFFLLELSLTLTFGFVVDTTDTSNISAYCESFLRYPSHDQNFDKPKISGPWLQPSYFGL